MGWRPPRNGQPQLMIRSLWETREFRERFPHGHCPVILVQTRNCLGSVHSKATATRPSTTDNPIG